MRQICKQHAWAIWQPLLEGFNCSAAHQQCPGLQSRLPACRHPRLPCRYNDDLDGVLLSYTNVRVLTKQAPILTYFPFVRVEVVADVVLLRPKIGMHMGALLLLLLLHQFPCKWHLPSVMHNAAWL